MKLVLPLLQTFLNITVVTSLICNGLIFLHNLLLGNLHRKGKNSVLWKCENYWSVSKEIEVDREEKKIKLKSGKRGGVVCSLVFVDFISLR